MRQRILFVSHCILNTAAKVVLYNDAEIAAEEELRRRFVHAAVDAGVQLVQLPCPEFTLYGCKRWGHTSDQFANPFFRSHCRKLLAPLFRELEEYLENPGRFEVLGFLGVDGSPSCGVKYTCAGAWGGNLSDRSDLNAVIAGVRMVCKQGVLFDQIAAMLKERGVSLPLDGLFGPEPERAVGMLGLDRADVE